MLLLVSFMNTRFLCKIGVTVVVFKLSFLKARLTSVAITGCIEKKAAILFVRALITRKILRSKDTQCNTK